MSEEDWERNGDCPIAVHPLKGFEVDVGNDMHIAERLVYFSPRDDFHEPPSGNLQLALSPLQANDLAMDLLKAVGRICTVPKMKVR